MMQLRRNTFLGVVAVTLLIGVTLGALAKGRIEPGQTPGPAATAQAQPRIVPVQMPLPTVAFAAVAEAIKPAGINTDTLSRGAALPGRTPAGGLFAQQC